MRQDLASCIVFPDVSESFLGILPEPPEHSLLEGFLPFYVCPMAHMLLPWTCRVCSSLSYSCTYIRVLQGGYRSQQGSALRVIPRIALSSTILGGPLSRDGLALSASHILPGTFATLIADPNRSASYLVLRRGSLLYGTDSLAVLRACHISGPRGVLRSPLE